jgi:hypothetical protein
LDCPIHLAANNNRGKTTLVNSLQFLYISDEKKMRFGKRSIDDSRKHYFGDARSYIVYECRTPTGPHCMIVRGRGGMNANRYERFLVEGPFQQSDFVDDEQTLLDFDDIRGRMADRNLVQIKPSELWSTLAAFCPKTTSVATGRLGLLPIKKRDEYLAFCDVFVRLLSLQDTDARTLRQLVIESHAGDIQERCIDIPSQYREEFSRAERGEHELAFVRQASAWITRGVELRRQLDGIRTQMQSIAPTITVEASRIQAAFGRIDKTLIGEQEGAAKDLESAKGNERAAIEAMGVAKNEFAKREQTWDKLHEMHKHWEGYAPAFIEQMRLQVDNLNRDITRGEDELRQAETFDLATMRRNVNRLEARIKRDENFLEDAENTLLAALQKRGISKDDIGQVFTIANENLLKLIVDRDIQIHDMDWIVKLIRATQDNVRGSIFENDAVRIDLTAIPHVSSETLFDLPQLREQLRIDREQLKNDRSRLRTAEDQQEAKRQLDTKRREHKARTAELRDYDDYAVAWEKRDVLNVELEHARLAMDKASECVETNKAAALALQLQLDGLQTRAQLLKTAQTQLNNQIVAFNEQLRSSNIQLPRRDTDVAEPLPDGDKLDAMTRSSDEAVKKLADLTRSLKSRQPIEQELADLERKITEAARNTKSEPRYFNDRDEEWDALAQEVEASEQMEASVRNSWDQLFKPLGARMQGIVDGIERIKRAVERLQRGLRTYQVSNLSAVEISVEEVSDVYTAVEALAAADSLFNDPGQIDAAKKRLKRMIEGAQVIEIESLFELKISIQETSGLWRRAASLDEIGSTGTGMTVKAMIFIQLIRAIMPDRDYRMFFYIDGVGELDDGNLSATAELAVGEGILPITADPRLHLEPLAHPRVTVYSLGQFPETHPAKGRFYIDATRTYVAEKLMAVADQEGTGAR